MNKPLSLPEAGAEPVATVKRGGIARCGWEATYLVQWEAGAEKLPHGTHKLYTRPTLPEGWLEVAMGLVFKYGAARCDVDRSSVAKNHKVCDDAIAALRAHLSMAVPGLSTVGQDGGKG